MDIETFVSEALEQLGKGIDKVKGKPGIRISPSPFMSETGSNLAGDRLVAIGDSAIVTFVEFDLSVVVTKHAQGGVKTGLQVVGLELGGGKIEGGIDHTRTQRIKFEVPVSFPVSGPPSREAAT